MTCSKALASRRPATALLLPVSGNELIRPVRKLPVFREHLCLKQANSCDWEDYMSYDIVGELFEIFNSEYGISVADPQPLFDGQRE